MGNRKVLHHVQGEFMHLRAPAFCDVCPFTCVRMVWHAPEHVSAASFLILRLQVITAIKCMYLENMIDQCSLTGKMDNVSSDTEVDNASSEDDAMLTDYQEWLEHWHKWAEVKLHGKNADQVSRLDWKNDPGQLKLTQKWRKWAKAELRKRIGGDDTTEFVQMYQWASLGCPSSLREVLPNSPTDAQQPDKGKTRAETQKQDAARKDLAHAWTNRVTFVNPPKLCLTPLAWFKEKCCCRSRKARPERAPKLSGGTHPPKCA